MSLSAFTYYLMVGLLKLVGHWKLKTMLMGLWHNVCCGSFATKEGVHNLEVLKRNISCLLHHFVHTSKTFPILFIFGFGCFHFCIFLVLKVCDDWSPKLGLELVAS
jgi:hypothetical protein